MGLKLLNLQWERSLKLKCIKNQAQKSGIFVIERENSDTQVAKEMIKPFAQLDKRLYNWYPIKKYNYLQATFAKIMQTPMMSHCAPLCHGLLVSFLQLLSALKGAIGGAICKIFFSDSERKRWWGY